MSNLKYTLVTGGLGFIGLNYIKKIIFDNVINIDCKNYAANDISLIQNLHSNIFLQRIISEIKQKLLKSLKNIK